MGNQIPGGPAVPHRDGWPGHGRRPWQTKPVSGAPRWLLGQIGFWIALPGLDAAYHRQRLTHSRVRRAVAAVATSRKQLELQIGQLEQHVGGVGVQSRAGMETGQGGIADEGQVSGDTTGQRLASLRQRHAEMQAKEERLNIASRRLMAEVNAFQVAREAIETAYTAAEEAAQAAWAEVTGNADADAQGAGPASEDQN